MEHDLMNAGVLSPPEMDAAVEALLSEDPARQAEIYSNLDFAVGRFLNLDDAAQQEFRTKLQHFCRAYAFIAQIMPFTDTSLERLFLYGRLLLIELPAGDNDPMPQLSKSVQLSHLRIAVTSDAAIALTASDEPGVALPGAGKGPQTEPVLDKLSALISAMNDKYGADLGDADKVWGRTTMGRRQVRRRQARRRREQRQEPIPARAGGEDQRPPRRPPRKERHAPRPVFRQPQTSRSLCSTIYLIGTYDEFRQEVAG
jgi:type I restriction enzyme R subunit